MGSVNLAYIVPKLAKLNVCEIKRTVTFERFIE